MKRLICVLLTLPLLLVLCLVPVSASRDDTAGDATEIELNETVDGELSSDDDVDWYRFTVTEDGYFYVTFRHPSLQSEDTYWEMRLYGYNGLETIDGASVTYSVGGTKNTTTGTYGVSAGTYYIEVVAGEAYADTAYTLQVHFSASDAWEAENNGDRSSASAIGFGTAFSGALTHSGDEDWYTIYVSEDREVELTFEHEPQQSENTGWVISLYDSYAMEALMVWESNLKESAMVGQSVALTSGRYYVVVAAHDEYSAENYQFSIREKHTCDVTRSVVKTATCEENGEEQEVCKICKKVTTYKIDKLPHSYGEAVVVSGSKIIPPIVTEQECAKCGEVLRTEDWSYVWIPIVAAVVLLGSIFGIANYIKAAKK